MFEANSAVVVVSGETVVALEESRPLDIAPLAHPAVKTELGEFNGARYMSSDGHCASESEAAVVLFDFVFCLLEEKQNTGVTLAVVEGIALPASGDIRDQHFGLIRQVLAIRSFLSRVLRECESGGPQN